MSLYFNRSQEGIARELQRQQRDAGVTPARDWLDLEPDADRVERLLDVEAEFAACQAAVEPKHIRWLTGLGITGRGVFQGDGGYSFGIAEIEIQTDNSWMPMPGGREAMIIPGDEFELLAFFPTATANVFQRCNSLTYVGRDAIEKARWEDTPLQVHATLLDWMRAQFEGIVVLNWSSDLRGALSVVKEIRCDDEALGRRLRTAMTRPYECPPIMVKG